MNRREVLKSIILLTGVIPAGMVMAEKDDGDIGAEKEEINNSISGNFTIALVDEKGNIASEILPITIEATPDGMKNLNPIKFEDFRKGGELNICIFLSGKPWYFYNSSLISVNKGDTVTIEKGQFNMVWNEN